MKLTIKNKLFMGFGAVLLIVVAVSINNKLLMDQVFTQEKRLMELRMPTVVAGMELADGVHLSLAGLRGYMILGGDPVKADKFRAERRKGWEQIDQAMARMEVFSGQWTDPANIERLERLRTLIEEFRSAQQDVEDISHTPRNIEAFNLLLSEAAPRASKIIAALTRLIDIESGREATPERKKLLKLLADSRGSFAVGLASIRAYLLSGDSRFADDFHAKWDVNEARFKTISRMTRLFNTEQKQAWEEYRDLRAEFAPLPKRMFELRSREDWNLANYWLGTRAAPRANAILDILADMRASQEHLAEADKQKLEDDTLAMGTSMMTGTGLAIGLGLLVAVFISRMIVVPLQAVVTRAKAVASGDLTGAPLELKGNDELTELGVAINDMCDSLRDIVNRISRSAAEIGGSSDELSAITAQTSRSIYEQQSQTEQVAAAMNEMSATVQEVSRNIAGTAVAAEEANNQTMDGRHVVENAVSGIRQLAGQIENATEVIQRLEQDSADISAVMDVIRSVAEQTNLLALNAAIEAARAGEQGRGFAVVADEVRTLAARTQQSTEEINQVIEKLQAGSRKAVEVMHRSREEAQSVAEQAGKADSSLASIAEAVVRINDMSTQIASAAEQQTATAEEINRNIAAISQMADETASGARHTEDASSRLAGLGNELQKAVGQFRV